MIQKKHSLVNRVLALALSALMLALLPLQVLAETPDYVAEVKIGMGNTAKEAYDALVSEGYTVLTYGDGYENSTGGDDYKQYADLNEKAGSDMPVFGKGDKVVFLGYKTTKNSDEAITDLAVMNMRGGYSVNDYNLLMEAEINNQVLPFIEKFMAAVRDYRVNYASANESNRARAEFVHDMLNRMVDPDTGMLIGDLFLNESKEELGEAYDKLSAADKKKHGDFTTIFMQSNGSLLYTMESLLARSADTASESWVKRFEGKTVDDLLAQFGKMLPADAEKQLDRQYNDLANTLLLTWNDTRAKLREADEAIAAAERILDENLYENNPGITDSFDNADAALDDLLANDLEGEDGINAVDEAFGEVAEALLKKEAVTEASIDELKLIKFARSVQVMKEIRYEDGTLFDFFMLPYEEVSDGEDIRRLYPIVAALSEGQMAALDFLPLYELVLIGTVDGKAYAELELQDEDEEDVLRDISIYDGVNREIYQKDMVGMTTEKLRTDALAKARNEGAVDQALSLARQIMMYASGASIAVSLGLWASRFIYTKMHPLMDTFLQIKELQPKIEALVPKVQVLYANQPVKRSDLLLYRKYTQKVNELAYRPINERVPGMNGPDNSYKYIVDNADDQAEEFLERTLTTRSRLSYVMYGFEIAAIAFTAATVVLTCIELSQYYNVAFTPLPKYMVDAKDVIAYDEKGDQIVVPNQAAFYTSAETNRAESAEYYASLGKFADLNGDVGREWLALYYNTSLQFGKPIIASSLYVQVGKPDVPSGYSKGIHMFGQGGAANLVSDFYCWNDDVNGIYVFYQTDDTVKSDQAPGASGTAFSSGNMVIAGGAGLAVGALVSGFATAAAKKKKYTKASA